jgi:acetylornithine deacetylase/succinyl-diaminopimelate desuccinylase-like protein
LIAAKAVKATGSQLRGDLLLTGVIAETSSEPSDDRPGSLIETKDLGARYLLTHGGVADFVIVAEGTGFGIVTVEAGMAWYKIVWVSDEPGFYLPYLPDRTTMEESPSMIVRAAIGVQALERWAEEYQNRYAYDSASGRLVPKAQVGAIRGGDTNRLTTTCQVCSVYVGVFTPPGLDPLALRDEIDGALRTAGVPATEIDLYLFRPGHEAHNAGVVVDALRKAHRETLGSEPPAPHTPTLSTWRDINIWNEVGIPAVTYGPRHESFAYRRALSIESLYQAACVYARTIVGICNQEKRPSGDRSRSAEPELAV